MIDGHRNNLRLAAVTLLLAAGSFRATAAELPPAAERFDFQRDIRPLFSKNCVGCHGARKQKGGFRLDSVEYLLKGGENGSAIERGNSAASDLVRRVARLDADDAMPPKDTDALTAEQVGKLRAWIDAGAPWPEGFVIRDNAQEEGDEEDEAKAKNRDLWSFKPPVKAPIPQNGEANPIDAFVKESLTRDRLDFSPEADRRTLLRRLYLDLTGLPPTLDEQRAFLNDASPEAWKNAVERLLDSPHHGERWGRHWLDAARYADSDGYEKDKPRIAHFYRDWVIGAINRDLPYDRFIIEQIAGDELPNATQDQIVATGYLRNSMLNEEGGVDPEQFRMEAMFDRMDAIGKGILALGLNCMQCHDHKYDPLTQLDYYRLFAFLNNDHEAQPRVYTPGERMRRADTLRQITAIETRLREATPDWEAKLAAWEDDWRAAAKPEWTVIRPEVDKNATGGQRYLPQADGSFVTAGFQPTKSTGVLRLEADLKGVTGFRLEMLNDPNLPANGPGRSFMGTFGLSEFEVEATGPDGKTAPVKFARATADLAPPEKTAVPPRFNEKEPKERYFGPASYAIDGNADTGWSSDLGPGRRNLESVAVFATQAPLDTSSLTFKLVQKIGGWNADDLHAAQMGRFRISVTRSPNPAADPVPAPVRAVLAVPREKRTPRQMAVLFGHWRTIAGDRHPDLATVYAAANTEIESLWAGHPEGVTQFTLAPRSEPRLTSLLKRGDWLKPTDPVTPGVPEVLNPLPENAGDDRLTLARWMVDRQAPTTARAVVNRVWQTYFGVGLVATPEDFGSQGEAPSHPELLDWLAVEFMDGGWSLKKLHRLIVSSRAYRQSSRVTPELLARDPQNRLLARGPRFRVEGEIVRDIQLSVSGLLNLDVGGPAVMPPAPLFLFEPPASYAPFPWKEETGKDRHRRAVYTWRRRTTPYPFLQTFDTPEGNVACVRRTRANTPIQALVALNETVSVEAAHAFAARILKEGGRTDVERLDYAWRLALARPPEPDEVATLTTLMDKQRKAAPKAGAGEQAAYTLAARVLLNLDETFTKE